MNNLPGEKYLLLILIVILCEAKPFALYLN